MKQLASLSGIDWITTGTRQVKDQEGVALAECVPPIFPAYAKLFHPIYQDLAVQDEALTWHDHDKASPLIKREPKTSTEETLQSVLAGSTLVYGGVGPGSQPLRIRWADVARRLSLPFAATLSPNSFTRRFTGGSWPKNLIGPEEGNLASSDRDALAAILRGHTQVDRCLFHFWLLSTVDWEGDLLFEGGLDEVSLFPEQVPEVRFTPTHWFPEDHAWLVYTSYDLAFTLVGGSEALIHNLQTSSVLECLPITSEMRIDYYADVNGPIS